MTRRDADPGPPGAPLTRRAETIGPTRHGPGVAHPASLMAHMALGATPGAGTVSGAGLESATGQATTVDGVADMTAWARAGRRASCRQPTAQPPRRAVLVPRTGRRADPTALGAHPVGAAARTGTVGSFLTAYSDRQAGQRSGLAAVAARTAHLAVTRRQATTKPAVTGPAHRASSTAAPRDLGRHVPGKGAGLPGRNLLAPPQEQRQDPHREREGDQPGSAQDMGQPRRLHQSVTRGASSWAPCGPGTPCTALGLGATLPFRLPPVADNS